jgi:hypothetical protein
MAGPEIVDIRTFEVGAEAVVIGLLDPDCLIPDPIAQRRYSISQSHIDHLDARGEAPPAIRIGTRQKSRWATGWIFWELQREIRREPPALPAPAAVPAAAVAAQPAKRRPGWPKGKPRKPKVNPQEMGVVAAG